MKKQTDHRGFTLVELLVVIAIIGLLIALFVPNMAGILQRFRTYQCQSNLRHIGEALAMHRGERLAGQRSAIIPESWMRDIRMCIDMPQETYICPQDADTHGVVAGYEDLLRFEIIGHGYYNEFDEESPWMIKLSQTQYDDADLRERVTYDPPTYVPDGNPHIYWWGLEDWHSEGSDMDYEDIQIKVTENPNGTIRMDFVVGVGYNVNLVDMQDNIQWTKAQMGTSEPFDFDTGGRSSYGINVNVSKLEGATDKIVVVDYDAAVVDIGDEWESDPLFARHDGRMNALQMDGSVKLRDPQEIDPFGASVADKYWHP